MSKNVFPEIRNENEEKWPPQKNVLSRPIFGSRFLVDQNLYEYMIEFLLIFVSPKNKESLEGKFSFHNLDDPNFKYYVSPRMGLKRFIFYNHSKKDKSIPEDKEALNLLINNISKSLIECYDEEEKYSIVSALQDFLYGYAVILRNRNWSAQAILPLCPELIFCEASPNLKKRKETVDWINDPITIDTKFEFKQRNFLARGGEIYYLHIIQGLANDIEKKHKLEKLITHLLTNDTKKISNLVNYIQRIWEKTTGPLPLEEFKLDYIPANAYINCEQFTIDELINYLSAQLPIVRRLDILAKGIMFQVMRMLACAISSYLTQPPIPWVIDVLGTPSFRKFAHKNYKLLEESFDCALNLEADKKSDTFSALKDRYAKLKKEKTSFGFGIFKSKGKELHCIIPARGGEERFSLSEDIVSFLVLSIIPPSEQLTFDMFLEKLYEHYNIIIGPKQFSKSNIYSKELGNSLSKSFEENAAEFEKLLNNTGFLIELSDATSVVRNPYQNIFNQESI